MNILIGNSRVDVEVADNPLRKFLGLMFRKELKENQGMLFIFNKEDYHSFWMLFTSMPLEAIFISKNYEVVDVISMEPYSSKSYRPSEKAKYVLEVNKGFSKKNNIKIGSKVKFQE